MNFDFRNSDLSRCEDVNQMLKNILLVVRNKRWGDENLFSPMY